MNWNEAKAALARLSLVDRAAAEMAFYLALSLVPFVGISIALLSRWLPFDLSAPIEDVLRGVLPIGSHVGAGEVLRWARSSASRDWLKGGLLLGLWTSFRFMSLCIRALGTTVSVSTSPPERAWRSAANSLLLLAVWTAALMATPLFLLVAPVIESGLLRLPAPSQLSLAVLAALRTPLSAGVLFGAIFLTYRVVGGRRAGLPRVTLAALLASLGWIGASLGFSRAVAVLWGAAQLYGTLGSMVLFLIWAYLNSWILLLGGFLLVPRPQSSSTPGSAPKCASPAIVGVLSCLRIL
jgi:membrane protein